MADCGSPRPLCVRSYEAYSYCCFSLGVCLMLVTPRNRIYLLALLFAAASAVALAVDIPVSRNAGGNWSLGDLRKLLDVSEVFAHGLGVLLILLTVAVLDPLNRRRLPRVGVCVFGAGAFAQLAKHLLPRIRPNECRLASNVWGTFFAGGAADYARANELAGRSIQSFPSGHAATAVGLAFGLAWLYPRGRWLFALFAFLGAAQRIQSMAHYVSDTFAGAAIACMIVGICWDDRFLDRFFTRFESRGPRAEQPLGDSVAGAVVSTSERGEESENRRHAA